MLLIKLLLMKFIADVNIAQSVIRFLRNLGHDCLDAKIDYLIDLDTKIIKVAKNDRRIILTRDKDFIYLVQLPKYSVATIVFRLSDQKPDNIIRYLDTLLDRQDESVLKKSLTIIEDNVANSIPLMLSENL